MAPSNWQEWFAWAGVVLPLATLAGSAVFYVWGTLRQVRSREFEQLFKVMDLIGSDGGNQPSQMAAIFELRNYPKYKDVIIRMCENIPVRGTGASTAAIKRELELTAQFLGGDQNA
jgi:hypothetical protein